MPDGGVARDKALRALGRRDMSRREIIVKLTREGVSEDDADGTADWLSERGFIDDGRCAESVARRLAGRGYGEGRIRDELHRRGISRELWDDAIAGAPGIEDAAYEFYRARARSLRADGEDGAAMRKLAQAMYRRGFSWDEITEARNRYGAEAGETD
ncbi:MAG: recombination regulator RecX [Oscillospiraceae bacterium]|jgi:regulatory protein|nr:recombination regulator RecX [Oscillospiraceae bacterium]